MDHTPFLTAFPGCADFSELCGGLKEDAETVGENLTRSHTTENTKNISKAKG